LLLSPVNSVIDFDFKFEIRKYEIGLSQSKQLIFIADHFNK
jgi:hypothetical protein